MRVAKLLAASREQVCDEGALLGVPLRATVAVKGFERRRLRGYDEDDAQQVDDDFHVSPIRATDNPVPMMVLFAAGKSIPPPWQN